MQNYESYYCEECGLIGFKDLPGDKQGHKKWHDLLVKGFVVRPTNYDDVIWENSDYWITRITPSSKISQRKKAEKASRSASKSLWREDFSYHTYDAKETTNKDDLNLFLIHYKNRAVGLIVTKKKECIEAKWEQDDLAFTDRITVSPILVIEMIWIVTLHRQKGLAKKSIFAIAEYFSINHESIGWSLPFSKLGESLVKSISSNKIYVYSSGM